MPDTKLKLYSFPLSGHAHRAELALSLLGIDADIHNLDLATGEQRSDWFKALNPAGKVPVLVDGDIVISESTAILTYLAAKFDKGGNWIPQDAAGAAEVEQWFAVASAGLATGPARARLITVFGAKYDQAETIKDAHAFLAYLNDRLEGRKFLLGAHASFADVAIYSYTAHAPEGLVPLDAYDNIRNWIAAVEALDGFTPMQKTDIHAAA